MKRLLLGLALLLPICLWAQSVNITEEGGWLESAYIKWEPVPTADSYNVYYSGEGITDRQIDNQLIRNYGAYFRADILGLKAGTYTIKIVPVVAEVPGTETVSNSLSVSSLDRTGFAFSGGRIPGAYNMDGTLKTGAVVLYLSENTKNTVSLDVSGANANPCVGIQAILDGFKKGQDTRPVSIRLIGQVTDPSYMLSGDLVIENKNIATSSITLEGVGEDAVADGWGIRVKNASNIEIRNIATMNCNSGEGDNIGLQQNNDHIWVHHCDFFYGDAGGDADQAKGDGALDCKKSKWVTFAYNHFWDAGKSNLLGLSEGADPDLYITYHHNWYDHSDSRHPRVRYYSAHVYNNYYDGNSKYGVGATENSSVFVEGNYFRNCKYPILTSMQGSDVFDESSQSNDYSDMPTFSKENGGTIKAFNNYMEGQQRFVAYGASGYPNSSVDFDAYVVQNRNDQVPSTVKSAYGANTYNNFDTGQNMYSYTADSPEEAKAKVMQYAGRMHGGDLEWTFNNAVDDISYAVISGLKSAIVNYETSLVSIQGEEGGTGDGGGDDGGGDDGGDDGGGTTGDLIHNFTLNGMSSTFLAITGSLSTTKGTVIYDGLTLTQCLKMESATSITFTTEAESTLTMVFNDIASSTVKVNGATTAIPAGGVLTVTIAAGSHTIAKGTTTNMYYLVIDFPETAENTAPTVANIVSDKYFETDFVSTTVDLSSVFTDADDDALSFTAESDNESVITVSTDGNTLTINEVGIGIATITVTADDEITGTATTTFKVNVNTSGNEVPTVANVIASQLAQEGFTNTTIDLTSVFEDLDEDPLTFSAESGNESIITVSVDGNTLTVTEVGVGTTNITVTADDELGGIGTTTFAFKVNANPTVTNAISDASAQQGFTRTTINLASVFSDANQDALTFSAESDNESAVTVSVNGNTLTITEVGQGVANITVTANDGIGGTGTDSFEFEVTESLPNNAPTVANAIEDQSATEGFTSTIIDLSSVFADADEDELSFGAESDNQSVVTVSVEGNELIITEIGLGTANITVTANDGNEGSVSDEFAFQVNEATSSEGDEIHNFTTSGISSSFYSITGNLSTSKGTVNYEGLVLTQCLKMESITEVAFSTEQEAVLTLVFNEGFNGTVKLNAENKDIVNGITTLTIPAGSYLIQKGVTTNLYYMIVHYTDGSGSENSAPTVANAIEGQSMVAGFTSTTIDLSSVFADADEDELTFGAESDNESAVTVSVEGNMLTITEIGLGSANITVTANDGNEGSVSDTFVFEVIDPSANTAPTVVNAIADQLVQVGFTSTTLDLSSVFADADEDGLTFSAASSSESVVTVSVDGNTLTITEIGTGNSNITVTANDGNEGTVDDVFAITVNAAPTVANAIANQAKTVGFASFTIDLTNTFTDTNGDNLTLTAESNNTGVATVGVAGKTLTVTEVGTGAATVTVTANDGKGGSTTDSFIVTVNGQVLGLGDKSLLSVYPNPTYGKVMIASAVQGQYAVFDVNGRMVKTGSTNQEVDLSELKTGLYLIKMDTAQGNIVTRIVKR